MLLHDEDGGNAVLDYWAAATDGYLDLSGSELLPWVDLTITDPALPRAEQVEQALEATIDATGRDLLEFDGFLVLVHPAVIQLPNPQILKPGQPPSVPVVMTDAGTTTRKDGRKAATFHYINRDHTFMCHETGHVLGFEHTFGVTNTGMDWDQKAPWTSGPDYGDPYDVMSSASFGTCNDPALGRTVSRPTFPLTVPNGWAVAPTLAWLPNPAGTTTGAGPLPARAHVDYVFPDAFDRAIARLPMPQLNQPSQRVRLYAAVMGRGTRLVALRHPQEPANGVGRVYLEYRRAQGWDRGLDLSGTDLARQAVVAHSVTKTTGGPRLWYRGRIVIPTEVDTDLRVEATSVTVRVVAVDDNHEHVDLEIDLAFDRGITLDVSRDDIVVNQGELGRAHTPCGDPIRTISRIYRTEMRYEPSVHGYDGHGVIRWSVAGQQLSQSPSPLAVDTPQGQVGISYVIDATTQALTLTSKRGDGYSVEVQATVRDEAGDEARTASAAFDPVGSFEGVAPEDMGLIDQCWQKWAKSKRLKPHEMLRRREIFVGRRDGGLVIDDDRLGAAIREALGAEADQLEPEAIEALSQLLKLRGGVVPQR